MRALASSANAGRLPGIGLEPGDQHAVAFDDRAFDHRRLRQHQRDRLVLVEIDLVGIRERTKRRARAIEHGFAGRPASAQFFARKVVPARLSTVSQPNALVQRRSEALSAPAFL